MIVIPNGTPDVCVRIIRAMQLRIPILENPIGSNRSPEIDAMCRKYGVPLGSSWCALLASDVWEEAGAEIPPTTGDSHPAMCESWRKWALNTGRFAMKPQLGYAALYGHGGNKPAHHIAVCVVSLIPILLDFEGNTSETGYSREGELTEMKRVNTDNLIGYVSPLPLTVMS